MQVVAVLERFDDPLLCQAWFAGACRLRQSTTTRYSCTESGHNSHVKHKTCSTVVVGCSFFSGYPVRPCHFALKRLPTSHHIGGQAQRTFTCQPSSGFVRLNHHSRFKLCICPHVTFRAQNLCSAALCRTKWWIYLCLCVVCLVEWLVVASMLTNC